MLKSENNDNAYFKILEIIKCQWIAIASFTKCDFPPKTPATVLVFGEKFENKKLQKIESKADDFVI